MALHCAATLLLVPLGTAAGGALGAGVAVADPLEPGADVVGELQGLADLHRGERVVVPVTAEQLARVFDHLGRRAPASSGPGSSTRLEVGDDGWALVGE